MRLCLLKLCLYTELFPTDSPQKIVWDSTNIVTETLNTFPVCEGKFLALYFYSSLDFLSYPLWSCPSPFRIGSLQIILRETKNMYEKDGCIYLLWFLFLLAFKLHFGQVEQQLPSFVASSVTAFASLFLEFISCTPFGKLAGQLSGV